MGSDFLFHELHPNAAPVGSALRLSAICSGAISALGLPLLLAVLFLVSRSFPMMAAQGMSVFFAGIVAVIAAESLWRLHCPYTSPMHLVTGHWPSLVVLVGVSLLVRRLKS